MVAKITILINKAKVLLEKTQAKKVGTAVSIHNTTLTFAFEKFLFAIEDAWLPLGANNLL